MNELTTGGKKKKGSRFPLHWYKDLSNRPETPQIAKRLSSQSLFYMLASRQDMIIPLK